MSVETKSKIARRRDAAKREANGAYMEKRAHLVRVATHLFKERGFDATTLGDVAEAAGMDRASMYYYFDNKGEVLEDAVTGVMNENLEMLRGLLKSDLNPPDRITALFAASLESFDRNYPQVFVYIQEDMTRIGRRKDAWARRTLKQTREFEQLLNDLVKDGIAGGWFRDDLDATIVAYAYWGMINWTHRWYRPGKHDHTAVARTFAMMFLDGVRAD